MITRKRKDSLGLGLGLGREAIGEVDFAFFFGAVYGGEIGAMLGDDGWNVDGGGAVGVGGMQEVIPFVGIGIVIVEFLVAVVPAEVAEAIGPDGVVVEVPSAKGGR